MEGFLLFFEQLTNAQKLAWVMICLGLSWTLEGSLPLVRLQYRKWRHAAVNSAFLLTTLAINAAFGVLSLQVAQWTGTQEFGLLHLVAWPTVVELLVAIVALDFSAQYGAHWLLHKVPVLWRFHVVHHSDTKVDATTGTRLHPGDFAVREVIALVALLVTGAPLAFYLVYRIITVFFTYMTHANVALPERLDRALSWIFVTPNMHKFHHHFERPWTDTNYGGILAVWDRLFGTFVEGDVHSVVYGVDVADRARDEDVVHQFGLPFAAGSPSRRSTKETAP